MKNDDFYDKRDYSPRHRPRAVAVSDFSVQELQAELQRKTEAELERARLANEAHLDKLIETANAGLDALCEIGEKYRTLVEEGGPGCKTAPFGRVAGTTPKHRIKRKESSTEENKE